MSPSKEVLDIATIVSDIAQSFIDGGYTSPKIPFDLIELNCQIALLRLEKLEHLMPNFDNTLFRAAIKIHFNTIKELFEYRELKGYFLQSPDTFIKALGNELLNCSKQYLPQ